MPLPKCCSGLIADVCVMTSSHHQSGTAVSQGRAWSAAPRGGRLARPALPHPPARRAATPPSPRTARSAAHGAQRDGVLPRTIAPPRKVHTAVTTYSLMGSHAIPAARSGSAAAPPSVRCPVAPFLRPCTSQQVRMQGRNPGTRNRGQCAAPSMPGCVDQALQRAACFQARRANG